MANVGRNFIVLFDGTDGTFGSNTNIGRFNESFPHSPPTTHTKYIRGTNIVTEAPIRQTLFPTEITRDIISAYDDLSLQNISIEDRIYIFGYSRGAISARALAQCITNPNFHSEIIKGEAVNHNKFPSRRVDILGVFDPVFGRGSRAPKHEISASKNKRINTYIEIVARNEHRWLFKLRSSILRFEQALKPPKLPAKQDDYYKNILSHSSYKESGVVEFKSSRQFISLNGGHSDIGHQMGDKVIGNHSFLTMLALACEHSPELKLSLEKERVSDAHSFLMSSDDPSPNSGLKRLPRNLRVIRNCGYEFSRRGRITSNKLFMHHYINNDSRQDISILHPNYLELLS